MSTAAKLLATRVARLCVRTAMKELSRIMLTCQEDSTAAGLLLDDLLEGREASVDIIATMLDPDGGAS